MRSDLYWLYMANEFYVITRDFKPGSQNKQTNKERRKPKLSSPTSYLGIFAIIILGVLLKSKSVGQLIGVRNEQFSRLVLSELKAITLASMVEPVFIIRKVPNFEVPVRLLTDNRLQITYNVFLAVCALLKLNSSTTTEYFSEVVCHIKR